MAIFTEKELAEALKNNQESIEITGDLRDRVVRIKATGIVSWAVVIGAIGIAALVAVKSTDKAEHATGIIGFAAISVLGAPAATSAVAIALAAGSIGVLTTLRKYKIVSQSENRILLRRE